jgi:hypothetical protein
MYGNLKEDHPFLPSLPLGSMPPNSVPCKNVFGKNTQFLQKARHRERHPFDNV